VTADGNELSEEATISEVLKNNPTIVGFSLSIDTAESVIRMCEILRIRDPQMIICLGGQHATFFAREILEQESCVDFIVLGEGEETMAIICNLLENGNSLSQISKGLAYKQGNKVVITPQALLQNKLDYYPNPDRALLKNFANNSKYTMPLIVTSRGCPYQCAFCSSHNFFGGIWRTRRPEAVVDEMEMICDDFGLTHFYFTDDQILGQGAKDKSHLMDIVSEILRRDLHQRYDLYSFIMMRADFHRILTEQELCQFKTLC